MIKLLIPDNSKDLQYLRLISLQTDPDSFLSTYEREKDYSDDFFERKILLNTKDKDFGYWGFFDNNQVVGYCLLQQQIMPKTRHIADLFELFVHPDHRNKHIATSLLEHCIDLCKANQEIEYLYLETNSGNKQAMRLYERAGFEKVFTRKNGIKVKKDEYLDVVIYTKVTQN